MKSDEEYRKTCHELNLLQVDQHYCRLTLKILMDGRNNQNKSLYDRLIKYYRHKIMNNRRGPRGLRALNKITRRHYRRK